MNTKERSAVFDIWINARNEAQERDRQTTRVFLTIVLSGLSFFVMVWSDLFFLVMEWSWLLIAAGTERLDRILIDLPNPNLVYLLFIAVAVLSTTGLVKLASHLEALRKA